MINFQKLGAGSGRMGSDQAAVLKKWRAGEWAAQKAGRESCLRIKCFALLWQAGKPLRAFRQNAEGNGLRKRPGCPGIHIQAEFSL